MHIWQSTVEYARQLKHARKSIDGPKLGSANLKVSHARKEGSSALLSKVGDPEALMLAATACSKEESAQPGTSAHVQAFEKPKI